MPKKNNDFFKGLIDLIQVTADDLKGEIQDFMDKYESKDEILYSDLMEILNRIAYYYKNTDDELDDDEADALGEIVESVYKEKSKELSGDELKGLQKALNVILFALGFTPLDDKGKTLEDWEAFEKNVYENFAI